MPRIVLDPLSASALTAEGRTQARAAARIAAIVALGAIWTSTRFDGLVPPASAATAFALRLAATAVAVGVLLLVRRELGARQPIALGVAAIAAVGFGSAGLTALTGREASPYWIGTELAVLASGVLMPWPARRVGFVGAALVAAHLAATLGTGTLVDGERLATSLIVLAVTAAVGAVGAWRRDRLRTREFSVRTTLDDFQRHTAALLAKLSHEVRKPLHVIIGYADMLAETVAANPDAVTLATRIRERSVDLHRLVCDLLEEDLEAGSRALQLTPVGVGPLVQEVVDRFKPVASAKHLTLATSCDLAIGRVVTDVEALEQVVTRLIDNAVKFTSTGRVTIETRLAAWRDPVPTERLVFLDPPGWLEGAHDDEDLAAVILVRDTGPGIRPEEMARLATEFEQPDGTRERFGGTGRGLATARRLAHRLGGRLGVRSVPGEGTTFAVVLPRGDTGWRAAA